MNDQIDKLRELVVRGSTEGERRAALTQLERRLSSSDLPDDNVSKSLVILGNNQIKLEDKIKSTKSSVAFYGTLIFLVIAADWPLGACLAFSVVVWFFVRS